MITKNLPAVKSRTLTGQDKVELWTEQAIWDAILKDMQVVVSTHAVLADAMSNGFVRVSQLGLLIFDEGRCCIGCVDGLLIWDHQQHTTVCDVTQQTGSCRISTTPPWLSRVPMLYPES